MQQDFDTNARLLLEERAKSIDWLANYYLHIRQAQKVVYLYLGKSTGIDVSYAGKL